MNNTAEPPAETHGSNRDFSYQLQTNASADAIWGVWMDVANWKDWDLGLKDARSEPLALGIQGTVVPRSGPESKFKVTEFNESTYTYAFENNLPGGRLTVCRTIISTSPTIIEHRVTFSGLTGWLFGRIMGGGFKMALPPTMHKLAEIAEGGE
ncbi:MAG: polyketide cyclase [Pseudomonadota bacterium]